MAIYKQEIKNIFSYSHSYTLTLFDNEHWYFLSLQVSQPVNSHYQVWFYLLTCIYCHLNYSYWLPVSIYGYFKEEIGCYRLFSCVWAFLTVLTCVWEIETQQYSSQACRSIRPSPAEIRKHNTSLLKEDYSPDSTLRTYPSLEKSICL